MAYWVDRNFCQEEDRSVLALSDAAAPHLEALRADPELALLHAQGVGWRRARFEELLLQEPFRALFGRLLMTPPTRALPLTEAQFLMAHARRSTEPPPTDH